MRPFRNRCGVLPWGHHLPFSHQPWSLARSQLQSKVLGCPRANFNSGITHEPGSARGIAYSVQRAWVELADCSLPFALPLRPWSKRVSTPHCIVCKQLIPGYDERPPEANGSLAQGVAEVIERSPSHSFETAQHPKKESLEKGFRDLAISITER